MFPTHDSSRTIVIAQRTDASSSEMVLLSRETNGALTLLVRNQGYPVQAQLGEDVEEYRRLWIVDPNDVPQLIEAWLREAGDRRPIDRDKLAFSVGRLIIGDLAANDEGATIGSRFSAWLAAHQILYRFEEQLIR